MRQRARDAPRAAPVRDVRKQLSTSLSDTSDESALPTQLVAGGVLRRVGRVSDEDFETSSYEATETSDDSFSDNSEEYVPLAFGFINGNPRRRAGAPALPQVPSGVVEVMDEQESLSLSEIPLEVFLEHGKPRRKCGPRAQDQARHEATYSASSHEDEEDGASTVSSALPIAFERRRRTRVVGKVKPTTYEAVEAESYVSLSDEEEAPLNAQLIYTLVKRLRNPSDEVSLEAFDFVDFDDENFKEELEPLKQIKVLLQEKASNPIVANPQRDLQMKEAVQSLPGEKAIAAKVQAIKSRQIRQSQPPNRLYKGGELEVENAETIAELVRRLKDPKTEVPLRAFEKVDWNDRNFDAVLAPLQQIRAYMEAKEAVKGKPAEGKMDSAAALDDKIKTAVLSLPSDEMMAAKVLIVAGRAMPSSASNGDAIRELVARLKVPGQVIPVAEFDKLDWNDRNFTRELEPLREIRTYLEAKEALQHKPGGNVMTAATALDDKIKTAVLSLPSEESIAATVSAVKSRAMPNSASNGDAIRELVARLKVPGQVIPVAEFNKLDWNDRNFTRELEPLQQIRACLEAKEFLQGKPGENVLARRAALDDQIKTAVLSLPSEKAIAVKTQMLKMHEMAPAPVQGPQAVKVARISAPAGTRKKLKDSIIESTSAHKSKAKEGRLSASSSQVMQMGARVLSSQRPKYAVKESTALSAPAKKTRRQRSGTGRNVSFSKLEEDLPPGEIVEGDLELPENSGPQPLHGGPRPSETGATPRRLSRVPSRPTTTKKLERRPRNRHHGNNISFGSVPTEEPGVIHEDEKLAATSRKPSRRRPAHKPGRNISITSLPDLEAGEMVDEPTLPAGKPVTPSTTRSVTPHAAASATRAKARRSRPDRPGNSTQFDQPAEEVAGELADDNGALQNTTRSAPEKKRRRARANSTNNRSCSFLEVTLDEAREIQDGNATELKGAEPQTEAHQPKKAKKLVRRRRPGGEGNGRALEYSNPEMGEAGELEDTQRSGAAPAKGRRANVHRPRSANASMIVDLEGGEITEQPEDVRVPHTPAGAATTSGPEQADIRRVNGRVTSARPQRPSSKASDFSLTARKRRQRLHVSKELSVSAIPENLAGEIVEHAPDLLATAAPVGGTLANTLPAKSPARATRQLPLVPNGAGRGLPQLADHPASSLRSSTESRRGVAMPKLDTSSLPTKVPTAPPPASNGMRRSTEVTPRSARAPSADQRIPFVRAST
ncbi:hypothetical protein NESM_000248900 [Novymonas esmeraldas]|uniref:Uncharacterized protein n=1 Tax=Novymonas esmeraldas TaxID=1808958 RepID=A0AAW0F5H3_9TRYP